MTKSIRSKLASLLGVTLLATSLAVALSTSPAAADDVSGTAQGLPGLSLAGNPVLGAPGCSGTGTPTSDTDDCTPAALIPTSPLVDAGIAGQDVFVDRFGHVASCAGLIAEGGTLELGDDRSCTETSPPNAKGLEVLSALGGLTPAVLGLDAAYAECTASATGVTTGAAVIRGLTVLGTDLGDVLDSPPDTELLGGLVQINVQEDLPGGIKVTALIVEIPGVLSLEIGTVTCQVTDINNDSTRGAFDTAGDVVPVINQTVQPGTRNALTVTFAPGGDRTDALGVIRLGPGVAIDTAPRGLGANFEADSLPAGCNAVQNVNAPLDPRIECALGDLTGGVNPTRTIPVTLSEGIPVGGRYEATAQLFATTTNPPESISTGPGPLTGPLANGGRGPVFGQGALPGTVPADRVGLIQVAAEVQTNPFDVQSGTTLTIPDLDDDLDLPENVPGKLYLDLPDYVESVRFHGVACDVVDEDPVPASEVIPTAYPFLADLGNTRWDCGQIPQGATANRVVSLDVAAGTPENLEGDIGRAVVIRRSTPPTFAPPAIQENSFYSNLLIRVTNDIVDNGEPEVFVDTTVSPTSRPAPGGDFTYTVYVENTSNVTEVITVISERVQSNGGAFSAFASRPGDADCGLGTELDPGESCTFTFVDALNGDDGDSETHDVRVDVEDVDDGETAFDSDPATAFLGEQSGLTVTKVATDDDLPFPGGDFEYVVTITNPNDVAVTIDSITDSIEGGAAFVPDNADDCIGEVLQPADDDDDLDSCTFSFTREFTTTDEEGDSETDTITVNGTDADGFLTVDGIGEETVYVIDDVIGLVTEISADPTTLPEPGGKAKFTIDVTNTLPSDADGDNDITLTELFVQYNPTVDAEDMDESTCETGGVIEPGETYTCRFTDEIKGNAGDVFTYTAWAEGETDDDSYESAKDSATVTLTNVVPEIDARLTVEPPARKTPGGDFKWTLTVKNISPASSDPITITSLKSELVELLGKDPSCDDLIGKTLAVGESISCSYTTKVEGPAGKVATELVIVKAVDDENTPASDDAVASVSLTAADVIVEKPPVVRDKLVVTGSNSGTMAAAAMLFAGLGLVLTGGGMQQAPELAVEGKRRRRR